MHIADAISRNTPRICSVIHVGAAIATLMWLRGGSEAEPNPRARATYIATHAATWDIAWFIWMLAAISLVGFLYWWTARAAKPRLARLGLLIGFAGILTDFSADALWIGWVPERYADYALLTSILSQVVANGFYSIAGAILMLASASMRPWFRAWGWIVWLSGFVLAAAGAMRWDAAIVA